VLSIAILGIFGTLVAYDRATAPRLVGGCRIEPGAQCYGKDLSEADLTGVDLTKVILSEGRLEDAILV
jgi:uncharacterized protein YjbI with pentapeptide repeats